MKTQMFLASIVVAGIVAGGVLFFIAYSESSAEEPWIVTGTNVMLPVADRMTIGVEYTAPGERMGRWEVSLALASMKGSPQLKCWESVRVGEQIPDCIRATVLQP